MRTHIDTNLPPSARHTGGAAVRGAAIGVAIALLLACTFLLGGLVTVSRLGVPVGSGLLLEPASTRPSARPAQAPRPTWLDPERAMRTAPAWCADLMARPRERVRKNALDDCDRGRFGAVCDDGRPRFFAQYNQDMFTWRMHWRFLRRRGTYVDIAANEPVRISNTYFFDRCLGWRGVCVEANAKYFRVLRQERTCALVRRCVSDASGNFTFIEDGGLSGIEKTNKNKKLWRKKKELQSRKRIRVECVRTDDALDATDVRKIDMLSLDVEGHELQVLQGIDWSRTKINVVTIENASEELNSFLMSKGFRALPPPRIRHGKIGIGDMWSDQVFVHKDVVWGKPV